MIPDRAGYPAGMGIEIRRMRTADVDAAADVVLRGDWGDRRSWFTFAAAHPQCDPVVAVEDGGAIVGTGVGTVNGPVGWVGTIFVAPERRRRGLGRALTEHICSELEAAGCRTLVLVATDAGRPVYERMGFEIVDRYVALERTASGGERAVSGIRPLSPGDAVEVAELDARVTGEDRAHLIGAFARVPGGLVLRDDRGSLRASLMRAPWGGGATIAADPDDALAILDARLAAGGEGHRVRAGILASNERGLRLLERGGWHEAWRAPRLHRGEPLAWEPDAIWGQLNHALG